MAPAPSPVLFDFLNHPFGRHLHCLRRQGLNLPNHLPRRPSGPHAEQPKARTPDAAVQPSMILEGPPPPPIAPMPSEFAPLAPEPSAVPSTQPQASNQPIDMTGNIIAAVVLIILVLGGLLGLVIGGEMLRTQTRATERTVSPSRQRWLGNRKSKPVRSGVSLPQQRTQISHEKFLYDEKTLTPLTRPPPALNKERHRRLSDVWPISSLSMAMSNRRSCPVQFERSPQYSPPTTWSEFSPVSLYAPPPRTILDCIPEELEDHQSQMNSDVETTLSAARQCSLGSGTEVSIPRGNEPKSSQNTPLDYFDGAEPLAVTERHGVQVYKAATGDEDAKSLGSSAPDMTSDGDGSTRSSTASLESLEEGNESHREEMFELRRVQTRSMQMNKGVLLSLGSKTLDDNQNSEPTHEERGSSQSSGPDAGASKEYVELGLSLQVLDENFSAVNLDEFPSLPSILPMIPSFVSGF